jgi:hypothetical protein
VVDAAASTTLDAAHPPSRVVDGARATAWISGTWVEGTLQYLQLAVEQAAIGGFILYVGDQSDPDHFRATRRPRTIAIQVDSTPGLRFELPDTPNPIRIDLAVPTAKLIQITIEDTYPAVANAVAGSPIEGVAISEIVVLAPVP